MITLSKLTYGRIKQPLSVVDASLNIGGSAFIFGQKGSGKTTLLELLCGMQDGYFGSILLDGKSPKDCANNITYLPQKLVGLNNKSVIDNLKFACDAINKDYSVIDSLDKGFLDKYGKTKLKKLSVFNKIYFGLERAKIKDAKFVFIDVSLDGLNQEEIATYRNILQNLIEDKTKQTIISINCADYKKLQIDAKKSEICYIFAAELQKFINFSCFSNKPKYMGMADYIFNKSVTAKIVNSSSGYILKVENRNIKLDDYIVNPIIKYFENIGDSADVVVYGLDGDISDSGFNDAIKNGEILLYDAISTERLG